MRLRPETRPPTEVERRYLRCALRRARQDRRRFAPRLVLVAALVFVPLWGLTVLVSDAPVWVVTVFWIVAGVGVTAWVAREQGRPSRAAVEPLRRAVESGTAAVVRIECLGWVEIEEVEDEGAHLVLQLPGDRLTFLSGQDQYPTRRFPAERIDLVDLRAPGGGIVASLRRCSGRGLHPVRVLPKEVTATMRWPGDLEVVPGTLADVERVLRA